MQHKQEPLGLDNVENIGGWNDTKMLTVHYKHKKSARLSCNMVVLDFFPLQEQDSPQHWAIPHPHASHFIASMYSLTFQRQGVNHMSLYA